MRKLHATFCVGTDVDAQPGVATSLQHVQPDGTTCCALQGVLQAALERNEYYRLADTSYRPPGLLGVWPSRACLFLENHDTVGNAPGSIWRSSVDHLSPSYLLISAFSSIFGVTLYSALRRQRSKQCCSFWLGSSCLSAMLARSADLWRGLACACIRCHCW